MLETLFGFLNAKKEAAKDHLKRNSFSWLFGIIIPLLAFGTAENIKLLCWKITVVCAACIVYHFIRKQMFPYVDPGYLVDMLREEKQHRDDQSLRVFTLIGEYILLGLMFIGIVGGIAWGL